MSGHFKTEIHILSDNSKSLLDSLASENTAFDFSKIIAKPLNHEKIKDLQNVEALYYYLTDKTSKNLSGFEYKHYFVNGYIPELTPPTLSNIISNTTNYLSKFKDDGTFNKEINQGYYPFPHLDLTELYESGKAIANMVDKHNIINLSCWSYLNWGSYTNALCATRIDDQSVSFESLSKEPLKVLKALIKNHKLSCTVQITSLITKSLVCDLTFYQGVEACPIVAEPKQ